MPARKAGTAAQWCLPAESCADSEQSIPGAAGEVAWNAAVSSPPRKTRDSENTVLAAFKEL